MSWQPLPYGAWVETRDTLHLHTQVLGKLALALARPEPQFQHAALRLTARGIETGPLRAPDGSGSLVAALDLREHVALVEHSRGRAERIPLTPNRSVAEVARDVLAAVRTCGGPVRITMTPQEVSWTTPLDEDTGHATYDSTQVEAFFAAATEAAHVLADVRAPYRGRSTPVNLWWGSFDLAVNLFSGAPAEPPSDDFLMRNAMNAQEIALGWWPGDHRYERAAFYAYAHPSPAGLDALRLPAGAWNAALGEFLLDWDDATPDSALAFCRSFARGAAELGAWPPDLCACIDGSVAPVS